METRLEQGFPAEAILKASKAVDLVAIMVESRPLIERLVLGTTAERVIRESHAPVLSIPVIVAAEPITIRAEFCRQPG